MQGLYTINPRQMQQYLIDCFKADLVPFVVSSPGVGKSSIARTVANKLNLEYIDVRLTAHDPVDLTGYPDLSGERATMKAFDMFPMEGDSLPTGKVGWLICLDEFASASSEMQVAAYKFILDRMVGLNKLHPNVRIVCLSNKSTDNAIVNEISTALRSRLISMELSTNYDQWFQDVALKYDYDRRIIAFLSQYPSKLNTFDPEKPEQPYCCQRSWEFMNRLIKVKQTISEKDIALYAGTIDPGIATEFVGFTQVFQELPNIRDIVKDPVNHPLPDNIAKQWATVAHLEERATEDTIEAVMTYINRFRLPIRIMGTRMMKNRFQTWFSSEKGLQHLVDIMEYLLTDD